MSSEILTIHLLQKFAISQYSLPLYGGKQYNMFRHSINDNGNEILILYWYNQQQKSIEHQIILTKLKDGNVLYDEVHNV